MRKLFSLKAVLFCLILLCGEIKAANYDNLADYRHAIYVEPLTIVQGTTEYCLSIKMKNEYEVQGFSFILSLPEGFSIATIDDKPDARLSNMRTSSEHIDNFKSEIQNDGSLKVIGTAQRGDGEITGNDGEIVIVKIFLPENVNIGNYPITIFNLSINLSNGYDAVADGYGVDEVVSMLTIEEAPVSSFTLDENLTDDDYIVAATDVNVRVIRTIKANQWSTICLPFAMTETQVKTAFGNDVQLAEFKGYEATEDDEEKIIGINVKFQGLTGGIEANHPYLINVTAPVNEFTVDGVDIDPEEEPTVAAIKRTKKQWSEMIGTYRATTIENQMLFLSGNKFWYSTGNSKIKAFRAYFDFYDVLTVVEEAYSSRIEMSFENSGTTGIQDLNSVTEEKFYDLQGRRVEKPTKGMYVTKGKKVIIK